MSVTLTASGSRRLADTILRHCRPGADWYDFKAPVEAVIAQRIARREPATIRIVQQHVVGSAPVRVTFERGDYQ